MDLTNIVGNALWARVIRVRALHIEITQDCLHTQGLHKDKLCSLIVENTGTLVRLAGILLEETAKHLQYQLNQKNQIMQVIKKRC